MDVGEVERDFPGDAFGGGGEVVLDDGGFVLAELFAFEAGDEHAVDEGAFNVGGVQHAFVSGAWEKGSGGQGIEGLGDRGTGLGRRGVYQG